MITKVKINKATLLEFVFIQVLIFSPMASILGNLLPSIGKIKFSWVYWIIVLFLGLLILIKYKVGRKYLGVILFFIFFSTIFSKSFDLKTFINVINSLNILFVSYILIKKDFFNKNVIKILFYGFVLQFAIILVISLGQLEGAIPLSLSASGYVNATHLDDGSVVKRLNGFFYHPFDLSIFFYFSLMTIFYMVSKKSKYVILFFLLFIMFIVRIKMGFVLSILVFLFYFLFIDKRYRKIKFVSSVFVLFFGAYIIFKYMPKEQLSYFNINLSFPYFDPQFLTGRGSIWNIYFKGIQEYFGLMDYIFGYGFDTHDLFTKSMTPEHWYPLRSGTSYIPAPHNLLLQLFVLGGLLLISFFILITVKFYKIITRSAFLVLLFLPVLAYGITASIMDINFFWAMVSIALFFTHKFSKYQI
ncbi:O-antigen ligase family protein [Wocania ichthyoenteri]|uniref:O-antigen ligase family protein n=1 Tax=Wocania ichthyoenteri TaxID=1230531 RepID=UPI00053E4DFA|nr:O-antigen ligase family protein [Wocania ichthyoenteri]